MSGGMAFRKDCEECGRSFLTPDKKAKICQRCAGKGQPRPQPETVPPKGLSPKAAGKTKQSIVKSQASGPIDSPRSEVSREIESKGSEEKVPPATQRKNRQTGRTSNPRSEEGRNRADPGADSGNRGPISNLCSGSGEAGARKAKDHRRRYGNSIPERCPGPEAVESTAVSSRGFDPGRAFHHRKGLFFSSGRKKFLLGN